MKKLVLSNRSALSTKYGSQGLAAIDAALNRLVAEDAKRGIATVIEFIDCSTVLTNAARVHQPSDHRGTKAAVDRLCQHYAEPDYVMLVGAPDVVAHYPLDNPLPVGIGNTQDPDPDVWSDLPYTCRGGRTRNIVDYLGPTRALGRLPDIQNHNDPQYLVDLLEAATQHAPSARASTCFSLSAQVWSQATKAVARSALGRTVLPRTSPPDNSPIPSAPLRAGVHIVNCHGALSAPSFYGDDGQSMPIAITSPELPGNIGKGTVAVAECCYGADLYPMGKVAMAICNTYLEEGAIGFLGSTTVAYGSASAQLSCADVLCSEFLKAVVGGASLGRALLQARLKFLAAVKPYSPFELKTIAQFVLLGDPSLRGCLPPEKAKSRTKAKGTMLPAASLASAEKSRVAMQMHAAHRLALEQEGQALSAWAAATELHVSQPNRVVSKAGNGKQPEAEVHEWRWVEKDTRGSPELAEVAKFEFLVPEVAVSDEPQEQPGQHAGSAVARKSAVRERHQPTPGPMRVAAMLTKFRGGKQVKAVRLARR
ncbi:MAG: hypothetical protein JNK49_10255 [Planctomycetes bacterium]|nr:hypothetical protein [Planctomycetota bacterium]